MRKRLLALTVIAVVRSQHVSAAVQIEFVDVGDAGNIADAGGDGSVAYDFKLGRFEVTNFQYAEFLNAVAATDAFGLFNPSMMVNPLGGIVRTGTTGTFQYNVKLGYGDMPVVYVSALDAARFANWLNNGQGSASTEQGAYNLTLQGASASRESSATFWIPSVDEWYKAAYHQAFVDGGDVDDYWAYPTRTNVRPSASSPNGSNPNSANYNAANPTLGAPSGTNYLTPVGSFALSRSFYGTHDQGGNVWEWAWLDGTTSKRLMGGSWDNDAGPMSPGVNYVQGASSEDSRFGFRVATVPEPHVAAFLWVATLSLGLTRRRRFRCQ